MPESHPDLDAAREHVKRVRDFLYHLMTFAFVSALLVILDLRGGDTDTAVFGLDWAYWVVLFWGLGVAGHAIYAVFGDYRAQRLAGH